LSEEPDSQQEIAAEVGGAEDASNEQTAITEVKTEEEPDENPLTAVKSLDEVKEKTDI
jgi:hypothetical protein